jgi:hypothetical protein
MSSETREQQAIQTIAEFLSCYELGSRDSRIEARSLVETLKAANLTIVPSEQAGCCEQLREAQAAVEAFRAFVREWERRRDGIQMITAEYLADVIDAIEADRQTDALHAAVYRARAACEPYLGGDDV